jgi:hypothetical protein
MNKIFSNKSLRRGNIILPILFIFLTFLYSCNKDSSISPDSNPFQGYWNIIFSGNHTGSNRVYINSDGSYSLSIFLRDPAGSSTYLFQGTVTNEGNLTGQTSGSEHIVGSISGSLHYNSGGGIWLTGSDTSGTWIVNR